MTLALFLLDVVPDGDEFVLDGAEGRHATTVKRLEIGERVLVGDGRGQVLTCAVRTVRPGVAVLAVLARTRVAAPRPRLVVVQALPKGERAELAVELMTELGVDEIVPWAAERSVVRWSDERGERALTRWRRTAREATKQSRRPWRPDVSALADTAAVAARLRTGTAVGLVLSEQADQALTDHSQDLAAADEVIVVVGPEGGLSPEELALFAAAGAGVVRLGQPVLRTSTAGAAAAAAVSVLTGRWT
ncbi:MAG: 16S rRNA (uracil(1498)-N(3))-methyltransferase [Actinobacteria bacterium]|nr:16S rRNA (uracil(1498)-N(3))-methyltransferase [Actinomycetota bacterium]